MKTFLTSLRIALTTALRSPKTWIPALLLILVFFSAGRMVPVREQAAPVQVGVAVADPETDPLWQLLQQRSGTVVEFVPADRETIEAKVSTSQWDCGIVIPADLSDRIETGRTRNLLTILTGPGSVVCPVIRETLAASVMELASASIGEAYLADSGILTPEAAAAAGETLYEELTRDQRVQVHMMTLEGKPLSALTLAADHHGQLLRGLLALVLLAAALYLALDLGRWLQSSGGRRMLALRGPVFLLLPRALGGLLGAVLGAVPALALLPDGWKDLPALALYLPVLLALAMALARSRLCLAALPVLIPFLLLGTALLTPQVPVLPTALFLRACSGSFPAFLGLLAEAAVLLGLAAIPKNVRS